MMNKYLYYRAKTSSEKYEEAFLDDNDKNFLRLDNIKFFPLKNGKYNVKMQQLRALLAM